jgi:acetyltransferase-like isoleucine patch superfamily enzyme
MLNDGKIGLFLFCILLGVAYYLFAISLLLLCGIIKLVIRLKGKEGVISFYSWKILGFTVFHGLINIADFFSLRLFRSTKILSAFFQIMGLKVGKNTIINTTRISDCDLVEIGSNCIIGGDVVINGHSAEGGLLIRKKVIIGNNVTLGQYSTILPGAVIKNDVIVGANSIVPKNSVLEAGKIYCGVPVRIAGSSDKTHMKVPPLIVDDQENKHGDIEDIPVIKNPNNTEILLKSYSHRHDEVLNIERFISRITVSGLGLIVTILLYSLVNNQPKLLALLPPVAGFAYAITINLSTTMLKLGAHMYKIEILFKKAYIKGFDWEIKEGGLGFSRSFDLDNVLINIFYTAAFLVGVWLTISGKLISSTEIYLGYPMKDLILWIDMFILGWVVFSVTYFFIKRKILLMKMTKYDNFVLTNKANSRAEINPNRSDKTKNL